MTRIAALAVFAALGLAGCEPATVAPRPDVVLPATIRVFEDAPVVVTQRDNVSLARDFMRLVFELESGRRLDVLSRFEGPVTVRLTGQAGPGTVGHDLDALLARLRREGGLQISRVPSDQAASISVELISRQALQRAVPNAACFVVPNVDSWDAFRARRNAPELNWSNLTVRRQMAVFIPADVSPQEIRDCLHEELAQALGPLNDLYRLPDSVFNDDNVHTVLTGFDMSVLRVLYDPALSSGMRRDAVAARLPQVVARANPGGHGRPAGPLPGQTPDAWRAAIEAALGASSRNQGRAAAAERAVAIARAEGWRDNRLGFSLYAYGRLVARTDPNAGFVALREARSIFAARPDTAVQLAHVDVQLAAQALLAQQEDTALELADGAMGVARGAQNAGLLFSVQMIRSVALARMGDDVRSQAARVDALEWAGYAYAERSEIVEQVAEIERLGRAAEGDG